MKLEFINRLEGNEVLGKSIFTNDGKVLLRAGTKLSPIYIDKMKDMGVFYVYVEDERLEDVDVEDETISRLKQVTLDSVSKIAKNTSVISDKRTMNDCVKIIEDLISYVSENPDVNKSLYDIQTHSNSNYVHSIDVCVMSAIIGHSMKLDSSSIKELGVAAILHDIGKNSLPKEIIEKPKEQLHGEELKQYREHPYLGAMMLKKNVRISENIIKAVQHHHERVDGSGYPYGLEGKGISKYARIISISNTYDNVTNSKNFKKSFSPNDAYELVLGGSGTMFDPEIVQVFRKAFYVYPLGCCVKLSDGIEGYVVRQNENFPDRPIIRVIYDCTTKEDIIPYEIDLIESTNLIITQII